MTCGISRCRKPDEMTYLGVALCGPHWDRLCDLEGLDEPIDDWVPPKLRRHVEHLREETQRCRA